MQKLTEKYTNWLARHPYKKTITYVGVHRIGRNDKCFCGSGLKFKRCCWHKYTESRAKEPSPEVEKYLKKERVWIKKKYKKLTNS